MGRRKVLGILAALFVVGSLRHVEGPILMLTALLDDLVVVEPSAFGEASDPLLAVSRSDKTKAGDLGPPA